mmetsp:Transcript_24293/g.49213  ORF Transcript_24293/g.49213 Transcript_24293/m.49213 type:complete len:273 (+) Transcript_24293:113-931(+)
MEPEVLPLPQYQSTKFLQAAWRLCSRLLDWNSFRSFAGAKSRMMYEKNDNGRQALFEPTSTYASTVAEATMLVRLGFIRKVYGILAIQLLATAIICALAMKVTGSTKIGEYAILSFGSFLASSYGFQLFIFIFSLIILFALMFCQNRYPLNMALLSIWTVAMSMSVATACAYTVCDPMVMGDDGPMPASMTSHPIGLVDGTLSCATGTVFADEGANAVIMAATITAIIFFALTAFTVQSKWDFSFMGAGVENSKQKLVHVYSFGSRCVGRGS